MKTAALKSYKVQEKVVTALFAGLWLLILMLGVSFLMDVSWGAIVSFGWLS
jgi:hypothetical protein